MKLPCLFRCLLLFLALFAWLPQPPARADYLWSNLAGQPGGTGNADAPKGAGRFNFPSGVAVDASGNAYVADLYNHTVRKVDTSGHTTTLAGSPGVAGYVNGTGSSARFNNPAGVAVDSAGNVYVADQTNNVIRKITPAGVVTTLAGTGTAGAANGAAGVAQFNNPAAVALSSSNYIFVADRGNHLIRRIAPDGAVITYAGGSGVAGTADGTGVAARFSSPSGVAVDAANTVYVADHDNHTIRKINVATVVTTFAGTAGASGSANGTGAAARFAYPTGIAVDSTGLVYVADHDNDTLRKITAAGAVSTLAGTAGLAGSEDGTTAAARFSGPAGVAVSADNATILVADENNSVIRLVTSAGVVTKLAGSAGDNGGTDGPVSAGRFYSPYGVASDGAGNYYVADTQNHTIRKVTANGQVTTLAGAAGVSGSTDGLGGSARFFLPTAVAVDSSGTVYVADYGNNAIRKITPAGLASTFAGGSRGSVDGTGSAAQFYGPFGLALDSSGNVFVADAGNDLIRKITPAGLVTTLAGSAGQIGATDGTGSAARFNAPAGVAVGASGILYVTDGGNTIRKIQGTVVTTLAGASTGSEANGGGAAARFNRPWGIAYSTRSGLLYVSDSNGPTIRSVTLAGVVGTLAGTAAATGSVDGTGTDARFASPKQVSVDGDGNLLIADTGNQEIRRMTPAGGVTTVAGSGASPGSGDGVGSQAGFEEPQGIAVTAAGVVYVADVQNSTIRKISSTGAVSTLAGTAGLTGSADGTLTAVRFDFPIGLAVDGSSNVYVADYSNSTIRKITAGGVVSTLAGSAGVTGSDDAPGSAARFNRPQGVAVDSGGTLFVADTQNSTIRTITPGGVVGTLAGTAGQTGTADGTGSAARFNHPDSVAVDGSGNVYVADTSNRLLRKITPGGVVTTLAGSTVLTGAIDGAGAQASFDRPTALAADAGGNLYVTENNLSTIRRVTPLGVVTTIGGQAKVIGGGDGLGTEATFDRPSGIAVRSTGALYVADTENNRIAIGVPTLSSDADLAGLQVSAGPLTPAFAPGTLTYTLTVTGSTTTTTVTPTADNPAAVIRVDGAVVASGVPGSPVALVAGDNSINVQVVAENGAVKNYYVRITRVLNNSADLSGLQVSAGVLAPPFNPSSTAYTVNLTDATTSLTVTPTLLQSTSKVQVNGIVVPSGTPSGPQPLTLGDNVIGIVVTAQDNTTRNYTLTVHVADRTAPVITSVPPNSTISTGNTAGEYVSYTPPTATDNSGGPLVIAYSRPSGSFFPLGLTTVNFTVTDPSGNVSRSSFTVSVRIRAVDLPAARGGAVPGAGEVESGVPAGAVWRSFGLPGFDAPDSALDQPVPFFRAVFLTPGVGLQSGIFGLGGPVPLLAKTGDPAPGTQGVFLGFKDPVGRRGTAFIGTVHPGVSGHGLWTNALQPDGSLELVAQEGGPSPVPDLLYRTLGEVALNEGTLFWNARLRGAGVYPGHDTALFGMAVGGAPTVLVRAGDSVMANGVTEQVKSFYALRENSATYGDGLPGGSAGYGGGRSDGGAVTPVLLRFSSGGSAVASAGPGQELKLLAVTGGAVPGANAAWTSFGLPAAAPDGTIGFRATSAGPDGRTALYVAIGGGDPLPIAGQGGDIGNAGTLQFGALSDPQPGPGGTALFFSHVTGAGVTLANRDALFVTGRGGTGLTLVQRAGDQAPEVEGAAIAAFRGAALPVRGGLTGGAAFVATMKNAPGVRVINRGNNVGLWATDSTGIVRLVARTGGAVKSIQALSFVAGSPNQARSAALPGHLIYRTTAPDLSTAIVDVLVP